MILPTLKEEMLLWKQGYKLICGLDEVGRGCFAGPLVVGVVIFSADSKIPLGIADSKLLAPQVRERLAIEIKESALYSSVAVISVDLINKLGIGQATQLAFKEAIKSLAVDPDFVLIDAFYIQGYPRDKQKAIIRGDQSSISIAASSIIAKVHRDQLMIELDKEYPEYQWAKNKGYGTKDHQLAIKKFGLSKLHRKSFNLTKYQSVY